MDEEMGDPEPRVPNWIREQLQGLHAIGNDRVSIYRVPPSFRQANEKAFTPQMVSIGPFHHGIAELQPWEDNKLRYLQAFLARTGRSLEECIEFVNGLEGRPRACYRDRIDMDDNAFVKMMVVDSCFIIEVIWRREHNFPDRADYLSNPELISLVKRDLVLLENQIPFFVLDGLFRLGFNNQRGDMFLELSFKYFSSLLPTITERVDGGRVLRDARHPLRVALEVKHFIDLLRICLLPTNLRLPIEGINFVRIPNATMLHKAGMKFQIGANRRLLDMNYNNGLLEIPKIRVNAKSECLLKNLVALEICHYPFDTYIIDYIYFMDMLIDTATDVDLLVQKGIIANTTIESAEVAPIFNNLIKGITLHSSYYFTDISNGMNAYYKVPCNEWQATFKRDYCSTPWMIASTVAAIILLVLTLIQTICSIISLF